jgi:myo-inositol-1(or 4)-monophosphatase
MDIDINKIIKAAKAGGAVLKKYYGASLETVQKTTASDFRTKADIESEAAILAILAAEFPVFNIFSEEQGETDKKSDYTFFVDPLDGTNNFVLSIPNFSVSVGLFHKDEIVASVVYSPLVDRVYHAQKGRGAYFDGQKLRVNKESDIRKATVCHNCNYGHFTEEQKAVRGLYAQAIKRAMTNWSPAFDLCLLASGRVEVIINNDSEVYDFAAGKLIAREAGALITDFQGRPEINDRNRKFIASNGTDIHKHIVAVMAGE